MHYAAFTLLCTQPATHLQEFSLQFCFVLRCMHYAAFHIAVQTTCHAPARILSSVLFCAEVHALCCFSHCCADNLPRTCKNSLFSFVCFWGALPCPHSSHRCPRSSHHRSLSSQQIPQIPVLIAAIADRLPLKIKLSCRLKDQALTRSSVPCRCSISHQMSSELNGKGGDDLLCLCTVC